MTLRSLTRYSGTLQPYSNDRPPVFLKSVVSTLPPPLCSPHPPPSPSPPPPPPILLPKRHFPFFTSRLSVSVQGQRTSPCYPGDHRARLSNTMHLHHPWESFQFRSASRVPAIQVPTFAFSRILPFVSVSMSSITSC